MPTFDFLCASCSKAFEELVLGSETIECPECGSKKVKKQVSAAKLGVPSSRRHAVNVPASSSAPPSRDCGTG
ncbi:Zinc ribbon domain protein [Planctomycetes bacterium Poly30]|uniref:Zinc ribbon domain protein n=1 Tax=Saltatorellus ferox TaxID=2528018 RepID=A0A518EQ47_9BACT|nr:Zinc ribbon domain protein [Planctomycetes bacterium Poly30]